MFLVSNPIATLKDPVPTSLRMYMKSRGSLPKNMIILNIEQTHTPYTKEDERYKVVDFGSDIYSVRAKFGFMEKPDTGAVLNYIYDQELFDDKFLRCTLEVSEDDIIVDSDVSLRYRVLISLFRFL